MTRLITKLKMYETSIRWAFNWKQWEPSHADFTHAVSCIQPEEKERLSRFVFKKDVRASLIGRLMIRKFVNEYGNIPYSEILIERDEKGKPILKNDNVKISFNVSHQGNYTVLVGEVIDIKLGVDIMKLEYKGGRELSEFFRIMNRNFSTYEWNEIKNFGKTEREQTMMFCRHWALKESYVKAIGIGITTDLRAISFKTKSALNEKTVVTDSVLYANGKRRDWIFEESLLDSEHCVAVSLTNETLLNRKESTVFTKIDFQRLMANAISLIPEDTQYSDKYYLKHEEP